MTDPNNQWGHGNRLFKKDDITPSAESLTNLDNFKRSEGHALREQNPLSIRCRPPLFDSWEYGYLYKVGNTKWGVTTLTH